MGRKRVSARLSEEATSIGKRIVERDKTYSSWAAFIDAAIVAYGKQPARKSR